MDAGKPSCVCEIRVFVTDFAMPDAIKVMIRVSYIEGVMHRIVMYYLLLHTHGNDKAGYGRGL